jgi:threonyl-tRNA synthetase
MATIKLTIQPLSQIITHFGVRDMRILQLHSDFIEFLPIQKEVSEAEESDRQRQRFEEIVVVFTAVEKGDTDSVAQEAIDSIKSFLAKLKVTRLLIYPYAHLSSDLAPPRTARKIIEALENYAKTTGLQVVRAPFGWNKQFTISVKGHPLAEQSRVFGTTATQVQEESQALRAEERLHSDWYILNLDGDLIPIHDFDFQDSTNFKTFIDYEMAKARTSTQIPPHVTLMKRLELADNEPGSDPGNLRYYPKGRLIKSLLEQYVTQKVIEYGGMEVETPIMYDMDHPSLASYLNRFPARQYVIPSEDRSFFLRFSACFGQFLMSHDTQISYRHLPFRIYELTRYSFRREKSGELTGLRRLRAFTMPDVHAMCGDMKQTLQEAMIRFNLSNQILTEGLELDKRDYELAIRFTQEFYAKHKAFIQSLVRQFGRPALVEMWPEKFFYFTLKWELNFVDNLEKASALSTDQIDVENAERYEITYVDDEGKKRYPIILHCSPSGAIERCIYALLEKAYRDQMNQKSPSLPLWLSPTQIRFIPVSSDYVENCVDLISAIMKQEIRADIDDRELTVSNRIRQAEREWIPYIIVYGEKEATSSQVAVRKRNLGTIEAMTINQLVAETQQHIASKPFKPLPLPMLLSQRPIFVG